MDVKSALHEIERRVDRLSRDASMVEFELLGARNRARHAVSVLGEAHQVVGPGLILKRRNIEVLLAFTRQTGDELAERVLSLAKLEQK